MGGTAEEGGDKVRRGTAYRSIGSMVGVHVQEDVIQASGGGGGVSGVLRVKFP